MQIGPDGARRRPTGFGEASRALQIEDNLERGSPASANVEKPHPLILPKTQNPASFTERLVVRRRLGPDLRRLARTRANSPDPRRC